MSMYFVYIIQSEVDVRCYYIGITDDVDLRVKEHSSGKSIHTNKHKPWQLVSYVAFLDKSKAQKFEKYLKTGSGRVFAKRHF